MAENNTEAQQESPLPESDARDLILRTLAYVESLFAHELALVGNRMSWLAVSQSFLFAAYVTIATDPLRLQHLYNIALIPPNQQAVGRATISVLLIITPLLGLAMCYAGWASVNAAATVLEYLAECRGNLLLHLNSLLPGNLPRIPVIGGREHRRTFGDKKLARTISNGRVPEWLLPRAMAAVWLIAFLLRFHVARQLVINSEWSFLNPTSVDVN